LAYSEEYMLNIVKRRYLYFGISLLIIIPGTIALIVWGLNPGIDFSGGSLLEITFSSGELPNTEDVAAVFQEYDFADPQVQTAGSDNIIIRSRAMDEVTQGEILTEIENRFGGPVVLDRFESVGPSIGQEVAQRAAGAVGLAALGILLYITYAFRGVEHAFRYGVAAILAMLHDVVLVVGMESILDISWAGKPMPCS
jgi:preprotein translocase subunit SecF